MKHLLLLATLLLPIAAEAQTVCVILNGGATAVLQAVPCGPTYNPPATTVNTSDARWTTFLALQNIQTTAAGLLQTGVTMTFSGTPAATDSYPATADGLQALLNIYTGNTAIKGNAVVSVQGNSGPHSIGAQAFKDLYRAVSDYNAAVLAAQATAIATATAPVWPVATATSNH
jgi:hypothetical protein